MIRKRLIVTWGFKAAGSIPKQLYCGHDADEARAAMEAAKDKGYYEIKVCRDPDAFYLARWKAPIQAIPVFTGAVPFKPSSS
jgi:hypothetical protein